MKSLDVRKYNMLVRVRDFGAARADLFPPGSLGARTFGEIGAVVDRLDASVTSERSGRGAARQGSRSKAAASAGLRRALEAISRTARGVALDTPDILGKFQMPDEPRDHELATAARQFADDAAPLAAAFVAHGLPESFIDDLRAALATLERSVSGRALARETHVGARADITAALDLAFETLQRLDAIVENRVSDDPNALAAWRLARSVGRAPTRGGGPTPVAPSPAPVRSDPAAPAAPSPVATPERLAPTALPPASPAV
jgi:hypothetical protein